jgi:hypothetical protein
VDFRSCRTTDVEIYDEKDGTFFLSPLFHRRNAMTAWARAGNRHKLIDGLEGERQTIFFHATFFTEWFSGVVVPQT